MSTPIVQLGAALFFFPTFNKWVSNAQTAWKGMGVRADDTLCIDAKGRICSIGRDFMIARDEDAFPVTVYLKRADLQQYERFNAEPAPERDTRTVDMFGGGS
jgi:hypothetical protein